MKGSKIIVGLVSTALVASVVSPISASASTQFIDIPSGHWSEEAVNFGVSKGYINGVTSDMFGFGRSITRQDASLMIANALYGGANNIPDGTPDFTDVPESSYAANAISALVEMGAINGYEDGTFKPKKTITREEFAAILVSAFGLDYDDTKESPEFTDVADDRWSKNYIDTITQYGVNGIGNGKFAPTNLVTREQAAQFICNPYKVESTTVPRFLVAAHNNSVYLSFGTLTNFDDVSMEDIEIEGLEILDMHHYDFDDYVSISTSEQVGGKEYNVTYKGQDTGLTFTGIPKLDKYFDGIGFDEYEGEKCISLYNHEDYSGIPSDGNIDWEFAELSDFEIPGLTITRVECMNFGMSGELYYEGQVEEGKEYTVYYKGEDTGCSFVGWSKDSTQGEIE